MSSTGSNAPPASDHVGALGTLWEFFADTGCRGYSPLYDRICRGVADDRELLELVLEAPPCAHQPNVLLAAAHYLLLDGLDHPLAQVYAQRSDADPFPLFRELCLEHRSEILALMATRHTQTNEVGRSALIGPALTWVARRFGEPVRLLDVGTSAGLNLLCDRYLLDYGDLGTTGPEDSPVRIECEVVSGPAPIAPRLPSIVDRIGIDRDPRDLSNPDEVRWLLACVWPDTGRLDRTRRAMDLASKVPPPILEGHALEVLPQLLDGSSRREPGGQGGEAVTCLITTWAFAYFLLEERSRFVEMLAQAGRNRPLVWVAGEGPGIVELVRAGQLPHHDESEPSVLSAVVFDSAGAHPHLLGFVHSHGRWIDWRAP